MKKKFSVMAMTTAFMTTSLACVPSRVTRVHEAQVLDLSGRWNDTDSRLVAEEITQDILSQPWLSRFQVAQRNAKMEVQPGRLASATDVAKPVVMVGTILNKSHEHIGTETFIKDIERDLINGGEVRIVANSTFRDKLRGERADQEGFVTPETQKRFGRELGANFMLLGTISSIVDTEGASRVVLYQVNLELADLETNEIVWIGAKKIKKYKGKGKRIKGRHKGSIPQ